MNRLKDRKWESTYRKISALLRTSVDRDTHLARTEALALWAKGFTPNKAWLYDFKTYSHTDYLSDVQRKMTILLNGEYRVVSRNKFLFHCILGTDFPQPTIYLAFEKGNILSVAPQWMELVNQEAETSVYIKPSDTSGGEGVMRGKMGRGRILVNNKSFGPEECVNYLKRKYSRFIITQSLTQHPLLSDFFPNATNTVRLLMVRDPHTREGIIAAACLRIGTQASGYLDSFCRGGVSFAIDPETGLLGKGYQNLKQGPLQMIETHPDTGVCITGRQVPRWFEALELGIRAFQQLPFMMHLGWDLVIGESQVYILEGNSYSALNLHQSHAPLLLNPKVRQFYEFHGILNYTGPHPEYL